MKVLAIAWKDLRSIARNVPALVMMLVAPLALAALLGFAFGGGGGFDIAATKVVVANLDKGGAEAGQNAGAAIQSVLASRDLADVLETTTGDSAAAARQAVDDGEAAVAVIIPEDFSAVVYGSDPSATSAGGALREPDRRDRRLHRRGRRRVRCWPTSTAPVRRRPAPSRSPHKAATHWIRR